jgi:hypothetical protein
LVLLITPKEGLKNTREVKICYYLGGMRNPDVVMDILFVGSYECALLRERCFRPKPNMGWNINIGGKAPPNHKGKPKSERTRELISQNNVGFRGRKHSEETKEKMRLSHQKLPGRPHTEETKKKLSEIVKLRRNTQTEEK